MKVGGCCEAESYCVAFALDYRSRWDMCVKRRLQPLPLYSAMEAGKQGEQEPERCATLHRPSITPGAPSDLISGTDWKCLPLLTRKGKKAPTEPALLMG